MDVIKTGSVAELNGAPDLAAGESSAVTALVERAKTGDADAFGDLMRLYEHRIISIGVHLGLSLDDAQDACQDTFVKVFRYIHRFRSGEVFFKWLYRIALNVIHDHRRRARMITAVPIEVSGAAVDRLEDRAAPLATRVENADLARKLVAELDHLTRQERIAFVLRDLLETPTEDVGRVMGLSQVTVRRHCMSARHKLRERLFPDRELNGGREI